MIHSVSCSGDVDLSRDLRSLSSRLHDVITGLLDRCDVISSDDVTRRTVTCERPGLVTDVTQTLSAEHPDMMALKQASVRVRQLTARILQYIQAYHG